MTANWGSNSSNASRWKYDVFLSFRGEDTRYTFTDHLYRALQQRQIYVFRDKEGLRTGDVISLTLIEAIEQSRIAIIVFSKSYASSTWCLDELVKILECKKEKGQKVLPVFYDVAPSEVRHQKGSYGEAMAHHTERFKGDTHRLQKWRSALQEAANLSGEPFNKNEYESQLIEKITKKISNILNHQLPLHVAENPVGLESRQSEVVSLLGLESQNEDVLMLGIYGMGGLGKTTVAKAVYNLIAAQFDCTNFVADIRGKLTRQRLEGLQESILIDMLGDDTIKLRDVDKGKSLMKERLSHSKILLILDDVNELKQLEALAGACNWFGPGSRVIITTRNRDLLSAPRVKRTYELRPFNDHEALQLFCLKAFGSSETRTAYKDLSVRAVRCAKGLPLALEIIGSNLYGKGIRAWEGTLDKYERIMDREIYDVLRVSYDKLKDDEKEIFLDIAFFFNNGHWDFVEKILEECGFYPKSDIPALEDRGFIKIREGRLWMHDLIQDLGREIVRQESLREPGERSRLSNEDVIDVLTRDTGTSRIQGILLDTPQPQEVQWSGNAFKNMKNLRILIIRKARFSRAPQHLPNCLRVLDWEEYPSSSWPVDFDGSRLIFLRLHNTHPRQLERRFKKFQNLSYLTINYCKWLKEVPDVSAIPQLTELNLDFCINLVKIHDSVGLLGKLQIFSAVACLKLRAFPTGKGLMSVKLINLTGCLRIGKFPDVSQSKALPRLHLSDTSIDIESTDITPLLQEIQCPYVVLPGERVPGCFHQRANKESISFWIRRTFPNISVSFALLPPVNVLVELCISVGRFKATILRGYFLSKSCYVSIFYLPSALTPEEYQSLEAEIQEDWVQVELFGVLVDDTDFRNLTSSSIIKECGVHVRSQGSSGNISFSNPCNQGSLMDHTILHKLTNSEDLMRIPFCGQITADNEKGKQTLLDDKKKTVPFGVFKFKRFLKEKHFLGANHQPTSELMDYDVVRKSHYVRKRDTVISWTWKEIKTIVDVDEHKKKVDHLFFLSKHY